MTANDHSPLEQVVDAVVAGATDLALPLPKTVKRSFWKAMVSLITGAADVPAAWLESKAQGIRDEAAARSYLVARMALAGAESVASDAELARRAGMYLGSRVLREQMNREEVAKGAAEQLRLNPPEKDSDTEIDEDWLDMFSRVAEQRSNADMSAYLAKLLAGEIRKPGSFAPATVEVLAKLAPSTAALFQKLCCISSSWPANPNQVLQALCEPFGRPDANGLAELGFHYVRLLELQDAGLLAHAFPDTTFAGDALLLPFEVGGQRVSIQRTETFTSGRKLRCSALLFTAAGRELRALVHMTPNQMYLQKLASWLNTTFGLLLELPPSGQ